MQHHTFLAQREVLHRALADLPEADFTRRVAFRRNDIRWNLGHLITVQQMLTYSLSSVEPRMPEDFSVRFARGTDPASEPTAGPTGAELRDLLLPIARDFVADVEAGLFAQFTPYRTGVGVMLSTLEEAVAFNNFHEGVHTGVILSILKEFGAES